MNFRNYFLVAIGLTLGTTSWSCPTPDSNGKVNNDALKSYVAGLKYLDYLQDKNLEIKGCFEVLKRHLELEQVGILASGLTGTPENPNEDAEMGGVMFLLYVEAHSPGKGPGEAIEFIKRAVNVEMYSVRGLEKLYSTPRQTITEILIGDYINSNFRAIGVDDFLYALRIRADYLLGSRLLQINYYDGYYDPMFREREKIRNEIEIKVFNDHGPAYVDYHLALLNGADFRKLMDRSASKADSDRRTQWIKRYLANARDLFRIKDFMKTVTLLSPPEAANQEIYSFFDTNIKRLTELEVKNLIGALTAFTKDPAHDKTVYGPLIWKRWKEK